MKLRYLFGVRISLVYLNNFSISDFDNVIDNYISNCLCLFTNAIDGYITAYLNAAKTSQQKFWFLLFHSVKLFAKNSSQLSPI